MKPSQAQTTYLESRATELRESTLKTHRYRLNHFVRFCQTKDIEEVSELTRPLVNEYASWRRDDGDLSKVTMKGQTDTLRVFLRFLGRIGAVEDDLHEAVPTISPSPEEATNERIVEPETAHDILATLDRYHYASVKHVWFLLSWRTSARISSLRALDVADYDSDDQCLTFRERDGTKLKNGVNGERPVALSNETCAILDDFVEQNRVETTDQHGRKPLLSSAHGRVHRNTMRRWSYTITCPSFRGEKCDDSDCELPTNTKSGKCDNSVSPHAIRRGSITHFLREDLPRKVVSDRANVSEDVLEKHYDRRSDREKMEQRRGYLDNL